MHKLGCPQRNSPYAHCECDAMDMREHTEQLRRYNETAPTAETVSQLQAENAKMREALEAIAHDPHDAQRRADDALA